LKHLVSPEFRACFDRLPVNVQELARKNYELLKDNPSHPSLHFKKIQQYYSVRVGLRYRALGFEIEDGILWFWVGTHAEYDKITN